MESDADLEAWCEECAHAYRVPLQIVRQVLAGLKGSPEAAQILLEACAEYGLDPIATLDEALRTPGAFRISRPAPSASQEQSSPKARRSSRAGSRKDKAPEDSSPTPGLGIPARMTGMAAEICLALLGRATQ